MWRRFGIYATILLRDSSLRGSFDPFHLVFICSIVPIVKPKRCSPLSFLFLSSSLDWMLIRVVYIYQFLVSFLVSSMTVTVSSGFLCRRGASGTAFSLPVKLRRRWHGLLCFRPPSWDEDEEEEKIVEVGISCGLLHSSLIVDGKLWI